MDLKNITKPYNNSVGRALTKRGIPYFRLIKNIIQAGLGYKQKRFIYDDINSAATTKICSTKDYTKYILNQLGAPIPDGEKIESVEELKRVFRRIKKPVVIKPISEMWGRGVTTNITNLKEAVRAYRIARKYSPCYVIMEEHIQGDDYRILFIGGKYIAAVKRMPPYIVGNGTDSIKKLIERENLKRKEGKKKIKEILIDETVSLCLKKQGFTLGDVLPKGKKVQVRMTANICSGGYSKNVSEVVHSSIIELCQEIISCLDLEIGGIDVITTDIGKPLDQTGGKITEVNENPALSMHNYPYFGKKINTAQIFIDYLYPRPQDAWIRIKKGSRIIKSQKVLNKYLAEIPQKVIQKKDRNSNQKVVIKKPDKPLLNYLLSNLTVSIDL